MAYSRLFGGKCWLPLLGLLAALAIERPARAEPRAIEWTVTRAPDASSCPDAAALNEAVTRARGPESSPDGAPARAQLDVTFSRGAAEYTATVRARGRGSNGSGSRTLAGPTCEALMDAVVATIAVLLDDDAEEPAPAPSAAAGAAPAAESPPADPPAVDAYLPLRIGLAAHGGLAYFHRSTSSPTTKGGVVIGGELRVHPYSRHGGAVAVTYGGGIFGPDVTLIDAVYSYALIEPVPLRSVSTAVYLDVGPAVGLVSKAGPGPDHTVLGARASVTADLQISVFTLGITTGYHGGVPLGGPVDPWEGALTLMLRGGLVLDFDTGKSE